MRDQKIDAEIVVLAPESTKTSALAASALGCTIAEIAKTIAFLISSSDPPAPALVVLSGDKRVSSEKLAQTVEISKVYLRKMNADEVKESTGYSIGGVPPFPHRSGVSVMADESLFRFTKVWAAAGSSNAVMGISPKILTDSLKIRQVNVSE
ncbi:MAG TPA: YbaK/EbsC family protein [Nitrososphaerales archaeon]|nr:YbaK/EbsC family protein [Nitrososphaerales archaeon]